MFAAFEERYWINRLIRNRQSLKISFDWSVGHWMIDSFENKLTCGFSLHEPKENSWKEEHQKIRLVGEQEGFLGVETTKHPYFYT